MDLNKSISNAAPLYNSEDHSFASKAAQKEALVCLNRAYEALRDADRKQLLDKVNSDFATSEHCDARWDALEAHELPFSLHQYRPAKHDSRWLSALRCDVAGRLVSLRGTYKSAEVTPVAPSLQAELAKQEKAAAAAVKDDGFRVIGLSNDVHFCQNQQGTQWYRCDWYKDGARVSFRSVQAHIAECTRVWVAAGKPDLSAASWQEIKDLYKEVA